MRGRIGVGVILESGRQLLGGIDTLASLDGGDWMRDSLETMHGRSCHAAWWGYRGLDQSRICWRRVNNEAGWERSVGHMKLRDKLIDLSETVLSISASRTLTRRSKVSTRLRDGQSKG